MRITTGECQQTFIIVPVERETEWVEPGDGEKREGEGEEYAEGGSQSVGKLCGKTDWGTDWGNWHCACTEIKINKRRTTIS